MSQLTLRFRDALSVGDVTNKDYFLKILVAATSLPHGLENMLDYYITSVASTASVDIYTASRAALKEFVTHESQGYARLKGVLEAITGSINIVNRDIRPVRLAVPVLDTLEYLVGLNVFQDLGSRDDEYGTELVGYVTHCVPLLRFWVERRALRDPQDF